MTSGRIQQVQKAERVSGISGSMCSSIERKDGGMGGRVVGETDYHYCYVFVWYEVHGGIRT